MANCDEIMEKVKETWEIVAEGAKELAVKTAEKAKTTARIAKLALEINGEKDMIKKAYLEIGKLYYQMHRDDPDGFFAQLCDEITVVSASISAKEEEIAELRRNGEKDDIEIELYACDDAPYCFETVGCDCGAEEETFEAEETVVRAFKEIPPAVAEEDDSCACDE